ncbi:MAG: Golgi transport complex subunit 3 [Claussenomyces sp. TS43310]|nr:MAG: Golgi transport complex subunit 3 [Claussenomyces sp. TS43310]
MYEDSWYSFVPETTPHTEGVRSRHFGHRRKESLLKQPEDDGPDSQPPADALGTLFEGASSSTTPPKATVARRAKSYTDFYHVVRAQLTKEARKAGKEEREEQMLAVRAGGQAEFERRYESHEDELLEASQEEYQVYKDQLALSDRHLQGLLKDTTSALDILAVLSDSFRSVEAHTTAFQAQCEDLLAEQKRLKALGEDIGTSLQYYSYLEPITRRLNAPGASRAIGDDSFVEMLAKLDACIEYMSTHPNDRESEIYLTRYKSLLARTLNLLRVKFGDILRENTAQTLKRIPEGKVTMTSAFLIQAPQSSAIGNEMEGFMEKLCEIAYKSYDPVRNAFRPSETRPYETDYLDTYRSFIVEYARERQKITSRIMDKLLDLVDLQKDAGNVARWARECFQAGLEVAVNEDSKFTKTFLTQPVSSAYESSSKQFTYKGPFHAFLLGIINSAYTAMEPLLSTMDIPTAIELITWLRTQYDQSDNSDDETENMGTPPDRVQNEAELKLRLSIQFRDAISKIVFGRINEVLLRDIERYQPKAEDLSPHPSIPNPAKENGADEEVLNSDRPVTDGIEIRAGLLLGPGLSNAFPPVRTAVRLLMTFNDLTQESKAEEAANEIAYNIMHQTCQAIMRAAQQVTAIHSQVDGSIFAIKNLVLLKNVILAYEISGSHRAASISFDQMWATFEALRNRGELFNVQAYYKLLWSGQLLPQVVENVEDARLELDGLMRTTITRFREDCADKLVNKKSRGPVKDAWKIEASLKEKLKVMFSEEREIRDNLWAAVEETLVSKRLQT